MEKQTHWQEKYSGLPEELVTAGRMIANELFEQQIRRCLPKMDTIDRIIIRCAVLHKGKKVTERQMAALISKALDREYTHQAVHKRVPVAAKRLAKLMNYDLE